MKTLPSWYYADPSEAVDRLRYERRKMERLRLHKGRRIRALVKQAMNKGGQHGTR